jgi:hypothetical protein
VISSGSVPKTLHIVSIPPQRSGDAAALINLEHFVSPYDYGLSYVSIIYFLHDYKIDSPANKEERKMNEYRYNPVDYADSPCLRAEMEDFHSLLEKYRSEKTRINRSYLDKQRRDLFFSIKHRVVEGRLSGT